MAEKVIGVDVGTNAVRAAEVAVGDRPTLLKFGQVGLPPGAVVEGEVADPLAVASALRRLWKEVGFTSRTVRVGIASARVILRVVEVPALSDDDTTSALRLQLSDYVPMDPDATVFDFQPLADIKTDSGPQRRLLLAATHVDAVRPLADAVKQAGLKLAAIDVVPAALARALPAVVGPDEEPPVEAIVSLGAGVTVVVVAKAGTPMFSRTVTNVAGRHVTDVIASQMDVSAEEAEGYKRGAVSGTTPGLVARAQLVARPVVEELVAEIRDSLGYYASQPGAAPIEHVSLAGGGALLPTIGDLLRERLGMPVELADPFARLKVGSSIGFDRKDHPYLAPYLPVAVGIALAGGRGKLKRIDLTPVNPKAMSADRRRTMVAGGVVAALLLAGGYVYVQRRGQIADQRSATAAAAAAITTLETQREALALESGAAVDEAQALSPEARVDVVQSIIDAARPTDVDWVAVVTALDELGAPMNVRLASIQGTTSAAAPQAAANDPAAVAPTEPASVGALAKVPVATITLSGTAPDLPSLAAWIDAVDADARFADAWVPSTTKTATADAAGGQTTEIGFTAQMVVNGVSLVDRPTLEAPAP